MKKFLSISVLFLCFILLGCNNKLVIDASECATVLPNNYVLSVEEEKDLKEFAISKGYIYHDGRAVKTDYSDSEIAEMIQSLKDEFGEVANNYFGEITVVSDEEKDCSSRKAGSVFKTITTTSCPLTLSDYYSSQYDAAFKLNNYSISWGLWWYKYSWVQLKAVGNIKYTFNTFKLDCTSINYTYRDDVTNKSGIVYHCGDCYIQKLNTKYGWLPEMNAEVSVWVEHPWLKDGRAFCTVGVKVY